MVRPTKIKHSMAINSEPPDKSIPREIYSEKQYEREVTEGRGEETDEEWYQHITPVDEKDKYA